LQRRLRRYFRILSVVRFVFADFSVYCSGYRRDPHRRLTFSEHRKPQFRSTRQARRGGLACERIAPRHEHHDHRAHAEGDVVLPAAITLPDGTVIPAGTNTSSLARLSIPSAPPSAGDDQRVHGCDNHGSGDGVACRPPLAPLNSYTATADVVSPPGAILPSGMFIGSNGLKIFQPAQLAALSPMLRAGTQSWSMRLVGGGKLRGRVLQRDALICRQGHAARRLVRPASGTAETCLDGEPNLTVGGQDVQLARQAVKNEGES
jgi:hypothetical protein